MKSNAAIRDGADVLSNLYHQAQLLHPFANKRSLKRLARLALSTGELPDPGVPLTLRTPEEDHLIGLPAAEDASHHLYRRLQPWVRPKDVTQWGRRTR